MSCLVRVVRSGVGFFRSGAVWTLVGISRLVGDGEVFYGVILKLSSVVLQSVGEMFCYAWSEITDGVLAAVL